MATAIPAMGTVVAYSTNGSSYTTVAGVKSISGPNPSVETKDVTALDSPGGFEEKIPTIFRGGDWKFKARYDATMHSAFNTIFAARTPVWMRATLVDTHTLTASGYLTDVNHDFDPSGEVTMDFTFSQTGPLTVT